MPESDIQESVPDRRSRLIVAVVVAALALAATILVWTALARAGDCRRRLAPMLARVNERGHIATEHAQLTRQLEAIQKTMGDPDKVAGPGVASNRVAEAVYRVAKSAGVKVKRVQPVSGGRATSGPYVTAGVRATLDCKIQNLGKFLKGMRDDDSVTGLTQVTIDGNPKKPGQLTVTVTAMALVREGVDSK